jgi:hypothetical protein
MARSASWLSFHPVLEFCPKRSAGSQTGGRFLCGRFGGHEIYLLRKLSDHRVRARLARSRNLYAISIKVPRPPLRLPAAASTHVDKSISHHNRTRPFDKLRTIVKRE